MRPEIAFVFLELGAGTGIIFTGDPDQIDRKRRLDRISGWLAYAAGRLADQKLMAAVRFQTSVRSEPAKSVLNYSNIQPDFNYR